IYTRYLIGSSNGYVTLDLDKVFPTVHPIKINTVQYGDYRNISYKACPGIRGEFSYIHNNLIFEYSVPEFDKYTEVRYQHRLEGLYTEWSQWTEIPETTFMNLPFGEYTFSVRAMVGNSLSENVASYKFTVARPWYLSYTAKTAYIL